ncbi:MAG: DUF2240 family protein [Archaeoglobus sp.]|uniref:DUF2240 family protein n=1 Tax=Archaeoglobus sp. TaxID=1872626 RepID=UPI001E06BC6D|nr:DUF2240 family protein [Archaeoglobus sp.]MBO8181057.1 DUF2240 family protein [Archaeoglobus sp.]
MMRKVIAAAFKSKGKRKMKRSELIYTMSFDLNWFTHEGSKKVVEEAEKEGLLEGDDELQPTFDLDDVDLSNFKPDLSELLSRSVTDRIIEEIAVKLKKDSREVYSMVNKKQEELGGIVSFPVAALIVAKEAGIDISPYIEEVEREVFQ